MTLSVWKFQLPHSTNQLRTVQMPEGAEVLSVGQQNKQPVIWALVDPDAHKVPCEFLVTMTGQVLPANVVAEFIGTVQIPTGGFFNELVLHVFRVIP